MKRANSMLSNQAIRVVLACGAVLANQAFGHQVVPRVSDVDRDLGALSETNFRNMVGQGFVAYVIPKMKLPVHESITLVALGCGAKPGAELECVTKENILRHQMVLYGVRWPDDPPFPLDPRQPPAVKACDVSVTVRSTAQPECWLELFEDAGLKAKAHRGNSPPFGPGTMILYRSHFGDLQFMHSMGSFNGEPAAETARKMRMWAQFLWGVATGKLRTDVFLRDLGIVGLDKFFPGDITAKSLFATGIVEARGHMREVAFGALLHMVQDSFSRAHTSRAIPTGISCYCQSNGDSEEKCYEEPGRIGQFLSYVSQDSKRHDAQDTINALRKHTLQDSPSVVTASRELYSYWKAGASWDEVSKYLDCVLKVQDGSVPGAGPGEFRASP